MGTVSRVHTFSSGAILTAAQLNNEFDNLLTSSAINGGLDATNLGVTAGQATASKALVVDSSRNLADGTAGNRINNLALSGTFESTGGITATAGITSGGNIVSDTDSTDDLGTTSVRWANLYVDSIGDSGQALAVAATTLSFNAASTIDTSGNNNLTLDAGTATLTLDAATIESDASTLSFDAAATIDTSGNNNLSLDAGTATLTLDAGTIESDAGTLSFDGATSIDTSGNNALEIDTGSANLNVTAGTLALTGAQTISSTLGVSGSVAINGQNTTHEANSLRIGHEGSGLAQFRAYGPDTSNRGSIEFVTDLSNGTASVRHITLKDVSGSSGVGVGTQSPLARIHTALGTANLSSVTGSTQAVFEHTAAAGSVSRVAIVGGTGSGYSVLDFGDTSGSNNGGITYNHGDDSMSFATTNGTTKMSIQSGTEVWIANTSDQGAYNLQVGGTGVWGAGAYVNGSDEKIKQSITTYDDDATTLVSQMRPVTFEYTEEYSRDRATQVGFIAQDLQQVLEGKNYADGIVKSDSSQLNVAYQSLIPILTKAIQELTQRVKELENN